MESSSGSTPWMSMMDRSMLDMGTWANVTELAQRSTCGLRMSESVTAARRKLRHSRSASSEASAAVCAFSAAACGVSPVPPLGCGAADGTGEDAGEGAGEDAGEDSSTRTSAFSACSRAARRPARSRLRISCSSESFWRDACRSSAVCVSSVATSSASFSRDDAAASLRVISAASARAFTASSCSPSASDCARTAVSRTACVFLSSNSDSI
mmetsp:Transcript_68993/g.206924  ORF Transcript_68993/g.206924 Transcript_68993/m.206924 type:complete len:211 (+) Transcript_68993:447-1079(+)